MTNTEPQGIKDIREAKADYLESLVKLKNAEAEKVKAEAAYKQAKADKEQAMVELQKIQNQIEQCKADSAKANLTVILKQKEAELKDAEKKLAENEFYLQQTLNWIAVESEKLTEQEGKAIEAYTTAYHDYLEAEQAVRGAEAKVYWSDLKYAEAIQALQVDTAEQSAIIAANQMFLDNLPDSGTSASEIKNLFAQYNQEVSEAKYELANIDAKWALYRQTEVAEDIKGFATELSEWVVKNAALPAPFAVHFKADLPDNDQVNKLFRAYVGNQAGIAIDPENQAIAANFYSIPSAEEGLDKLNTVISALSRELVVDSTKYGVDTTGMSVALAKVWKDYNDTEATIKAGVEAYKPVTDAWAALKDSVEAKIAADKALKDAEAAYVADKAALKAAIENFVKVWNDIATDDKKMASNDTTALFDAFKQVIDIRKKIFSKDSEFLYIKGYKADKVTIDTGKVNFADLTKDMLAENNADVKAFNDVTKGGSETALSDAINQFFGCVYLRKHFDVSSGKLTHITLDELYGEDVEGIHTRLYKTLFFGEYWAVKDISEIYYVGPVTPIYIPKAIKTAEEAAAKAAQAVQTAQADVTKAYEKYYTAIYGEFWGIKADTVQTPVERKFSKDVKGTAKIVKLKNHADSLVINFTKETFTKDYPVVSFYYVRPDFYNAKKGEFNVPTKWELFWNIQREEELAIVMTQLLANQGWKSDFQLHKLLLTKVLWCQYAADNYSIGSEGTKKALARLQEIEGELEAEVLVALAQQVKDSEPFFNFVQNLFGKECLDGIFARIDSAATVAAQFEETTTEPGESYLKRIAAGKLTSKELFTMFFEEFMCGSGVDSTYRTAYEHMQIAKAFTGEEFADLVSDVIAAFIDASEIDLTGKGNIIEKILFGTVEKVNWSEISGSFFHKSLVIVAPVVGPYIAGSFGGKIAELQDKYFTEWETEWRTYDVKRAAVNAKIAEIETECKILADYAGDVSYLIRRADRYNDAIEKAAAQYAEDCKILAAIEAGADWMSLLNEKIYDDLDEALAALEAAKTRLEAAKLAYDQVLANHGLAE